MAEDEEREIIVAFLKTLYKYKFLIYQLVERDIKKKYRRSVLGILWSLLNPFLMMVITAMVFSTLFRFNVENYILYLLVGQVFFTFFAEATNFAMGSILENASLIKKIYVPKYLFPISRVVSSCVNFLFTLPAILIIMCYTGQYPSWRIISFIIPLALMLFFCIGVGLFLSSFVVKFRDLYHLYGVVITALSYATPIFYPMQIIPKEYNFLLYYNPLYYFLTLFREVLYQGLLPEWHTLMICLAFTVGALVVGGFTFRRLQNEFILYV